MQRMLWAVKRAYWRSSTGMLRLLRTGGACDLKTTRQLTPARYDVIHLLAERGGAMVQKAMCAALGVAKSTLSELLGTMERLGLVSRSRFTRAGRTVTLTEKVESLLGDAFLIEVEVDERISKTGMGDRRQILVEKTCLQVRELFGELGPRRLYEFPELDD